MRGSVSVTVRRLLLNVRGDRPFRLWRAARGAQYAFYNRNRFEKNLGPPLVKHDWCHFARYVRELNYAGFHRAGGKSHFL